MANSKTPAALSQPQPISLNRPTTDADWTQFATTLNQWLQFLVYPGFPQNQQGNIYTLVLSDANKHIYHNAAGDGTWTIPDNSTVPFTVGTQIILLTVPGAGNVNILIGSDQLIFSPSGSTGNRTLATNGIATLLKIGDTQWIISGFGLT